MPFAAATRLQALLLLLGLLVCQGRSAPLWLGPGRRPLQAARLFAGESAAPGVLVTSGQEFLAALREPDTSLVLLRGQLLHCAVLPFLAADTPDA